MAKRLRDRRAATAMAAERHPSSDDHDHGVDESDVLVLTHWPRRLGVMPAPVRQFVFGGPDA